MTDAKTVAELAAKHDHQCDIALDPMPLETVDYIDALEARTDLANAAVGAAVRACAEAILHDHTKPDDNRLWGDERPYICEESAYRTILALEPDAQQALDKLLAEKDAEIARKHGALKAVRDRMDQLGGFDGRFTLRKIIDAALEGE